MQYKEMIPVYIRREYLDSSCNQFCIVLFHPDTCIQDLMRFADEIMEYSLTFEDGDILSLDFIIRTVINKLEIKDYMVFGEKRFKDFYKFYFGEDVIDKLELPLSKETFREHPHYKPAMNIVIRGD